MHAGAERKCEWLRGGGRGFEASDRGYRLVSGGVDHAVIPGLPGRQPVKPHRGGKIGSLLKSHRRPLACLA